MATFGTFTAGQVLTAAELNTAGEWQSYTPTWTQSATITKTVNWARYTQLGKWVQGSIKMTASSAGTANNVIKVGLPVNASTNNFILGVMAYFDTGATTPYKYGGIYALFDSATTMSFSDSASGTTLSNTPLFVTTDVRFGQDGTSSSTSFTGMTVASGDIIYIQFAYEAA